MNDIFLRLEEVWHQLPNNQYALQGINLTIQRGEFIVLCGANGCGKTVLAKHLIGLLKPTKGNILLDNAPIWDDIYGTRSKIGFVFQDPDCQFIGETVKDDIAFGLENKQLPYKEIEEKVMAIAQQLDLIPYLNSSPYQLSGGEKHKLAIAAIMVMGAEMLILDEPFNALDYEATNQLLHLLLAFQAQSNHSILLITHDLEKVIAHATRLIIMAKGSIVKDDSPENALDFLEQYGIKKPYCTGRALSDMSWIK